MNIFQQQMLQFFFHSTTLAIGLPGDKGKQGLQGFPGYPGSSGEKGKNTTQNSATQK
jgi:hypothetical protein